MIWGYPYFFGHIQINRKEILGKMPKMWMFKYTYIFTGWFHFVLQDSNPISTVCSDVDGMPLMAHCGLQGLLCYRTAAEDPAKGRHFTSHFGAYTQNGTTPDWSWFNPFRPTSSALSLLLNLWSLHHCPNHGPPLRSFSEEARTASGFVVRPIIPYCWRMLERLCKVESDSKTIHVNQ